MQNHELRQGNMEGKFENKIENKAAEKMEDSANDNRKFWKGVLCGVIAVLAVLIAGTGICYGVSVVKGETMVAESKQEKKVQQKLKQIQKVIDKYYLYEDEVDEDALEDGIYSGYVAGLGDQYTVYYTAEERKKLMESVSGKYSGIGASLMKDTETGGAVVAKVYEGTPAEEAGVKEGDIIYKVDGSTISDEGLDEIVSWIRGEEGTKVTLYVNRDGEQLELTATRKSLEMPTVSYEMKDNRIGYIAVSEFDDVTLNQFKTALDALDEQGMQGLVIDLRSNPGGNVDTVTDMLKLLLPKGTIVSVKDKNGNEETYTSDGSHEFTKPMAVLVNQYSASASEIFSGAVQDYGIGKIVGTTTYGKGVVQQIIPFSDGTAMKVTLAEYFTPNGRCINKKGVTPDVEVEYEPNEQDAAADNQLDKALEVVQEQLKSL